MGELPELAKWRTSALKRYRAAQRAVGRNAITCRYFGARFSVDLGDLIGNDIAIGRFEYRNLDRLLKECSRRRPAIFIDVGANIGLYACAVGANRLAQTLAAFEPAPELFRELQSNVRLNRIAADLFQAAAGATDGVTRLNVITGHNRGLSHVSDAGEIATPMRALDSAIRIRGDTIAIKIDVEGFESDVIAGARALLSENGGYAQIEAHGDQKKAVAAAMGGLGWRQVGAHGLDVMFER